MAERRMFAKTIIDSDAFLDMPVTARLLYYDLGMRADDDGFVNSPKKVMRMIGASTDDINILIAKKFVIPFENGVVVIKHWKVNNYIRSDRYNETKYTEQLEMLTADEHGIYHLKDRELLPCGIPPGIPDDNQRYPQVRLGKDSIGKVNNTYPQKAEEPDRVEKLFIIFYEAYGNKKGRKNALKAFRKINPDEALLQQMIEAIEKYHQTRNWKRGYRKEPATWLNGECWSDDYSNDAVQDDRPVQKNGPKSHYTPDGKYDYESGESGDWESL